MEGYEQIGQLVDQKIDQGKFPFNITEAEVRRIYPGQDEESMLVAYEQVKRWVTKYEDQHATYVVFSGTSSTAGGPIENHIQVAIKDLRKRMASTQLNRLQHDLSCPPGSIV